MKTKNDEDSETISQLVKVLEKGELPSDEYLSQLKSEIVEDRVVSKAEADALFLLKNNYPAIKQAPEFLNIFVGAITSFLLYTGMTQGDLDELEYLWLMDSISEDNDYDEYEKALLKNIVDRAENVPQNFHKLIKNFVD